MTTNLAGLGVIYNDISGLNQQFFQLLAVPGSLTLVAIDGVIQNPDTYTIDRSTLQLDAPLAAGKWVYIVSGQGGTFVPQSYVDDSLEVKADTETVNTQLNLKANKSGATFTGPIVILAPTADMHPVTKEMWDTLPEMATPDYVDDAVSEMITQTVFDNAVDTLIPLEEKGVADGVAENDEFGKVKINQIPDPALYSFQDISIPGTLTATTVKSGFREKYSGVISSLLVKLGTAPTGSPLRLNITKNGTGIFSSGNYIDVPVSSTTLNHNFSSPPTFDEGDILGIRIESVGSSVAGSDLTSRIEVIHLSS